jgi:hypothetical protein
MGNRNLKPETITVKKKKGFISERVRKQQQMARSVLVPKIIIRIINRKQTMIIIPTTNTESITNTTANRQ